MALMTLAVSTPLPACLLLALILVIVAITVLWSIMATLRHVRENIMLTLGPSGDWRDRPRSARKWSRVPPVLVSIALSGCLALGLAWGFGWQQPVTLLAFLISSTLMVYVYFLRVPMAVPLECSGRRTDLPFDTVEKAVGRTLSWGESDLRRYHSGRYREGRASGELRRIERFLETGDPDGCFFEKDDRIVQVRDLSNEQGTRVHVKMFYDGGKDGPWVDKMKRAIDRELDGVTSQGPWRGGR